MHQIPNLPKSKNAVQPLPLDTRTYLFAKKTRVLLRLMKHDFVSLEDAKQLTRSSGSVGANYIEANESLSSKDFIYRIKICKKEVKESIYWLELLPNSKNKTSEQLKVELIDEASQLLRILASIVNKKN